MSRSQQPNRDSCSEETLRTRYHLTQAAGWVGATPIVVIIAIAMIAIAAGVAVQLQWLPSGWLAGLNGAAVAGFVATVGGALVAYQQWRAAKYEAALDKFYDRLDIANRRRENLPQDGPGSIKPFDMYVYTELDNLEYTIEKYKLGYVTVAHMCRSLETFRVRCEDIEGFVERAYEDVNRPGRSGYHETTAAIVVSISADFGITLQSRL